jgi:hypothetical protein
MAQKHLTSVDGKRREEEERRVPGRPGRMKTVLGDSAARSLLSCCATLYIVEHDDGQV